MSGLLPKDAINRRTAANGYHMSASVSGSFGTGGSSGGSFSTGGTGGSSGGSGGSFSTGGSGVSGGGSFGIGGSGGSSGSSGGISGGSAGGEMPSAGRSFNRYATQPLDYVPARLSAADLSLPPEHRSVSPILPSSCRHENWEACEEQRLRELEEARARAQQMEQTMRWWSDCTANWREKWSRVRAERNKCRDEMKDLKLKLDRAQCDLLTVKKQKQEVDEINVKLKKKIEASGLNERKWSGPDPPSNPNEYPMKCVDVIDMLAWNVEAHDVQSAQQKVANAHQQLNEKESQLSAEKAKYEAELEQLKAKCEELEASRQSIQDELEETKNRYKDDLKVLRENFEAQLLNPETEQTLNNLRTQVEQLRTENAEFWRTKERLESERQQMERELKQVRAENADLKEQIMEGKQKTTTNLAQDLKLTQAELHDKTKELFEAQQNLIKYKQRFVERNVEADHAIKRSVQAEEEVKKLRKRVDELRNGLGIAEDEIDKSTNYARKLLRANDELQSQIDGLQLQIEHLQARISTMDRRARLTRSHSQPSAAFTMSRDAEMGLGPPDDLIKKKLQELATYCTTSSNKPE